MWKFLKSKIVFPKIQENVFVFVFEFRIDENENAIKISHVTSNAVEKWEINKLKEFFSGANTKIN